MKNYAYNPGINFLRAIAMIGIVFYHIFPISIKGGYLGVCFFFIISGYLAAKQGDMAWDHGTFSLWKYYKKRFKRIYPPLFFMVMTVIAFFTLFHRELLLGAREETASILFGYNNWWQMATQASYFKKMAEHSPFTHLWYMGVEIELLVLWPLVLLLYKKVFERFLKNWGSILFVLLSVGSIAAMAVLYNPDAVNRVYYGTDTRAFAFFMGAWLGVREEAWIARVPKFLKGYWGQMLFSILLLVALGSFLLVGGEEPWLYQGGMAAICLLFLAIILMMNASGVNHSSLAEAKIMQFLGRHSYLIYLWHYPVMFVLMYLY